jgi:hypothetical protein
MMVVSYVLGWPFVSPFSLLLHDIGDAISEAEHTSE